MRWFLLYLAAMVFAVSAAKAAPAPCWKAVIADWYVDGRVDSAYRCSCWQDAIDHLPTSGLTYSSVGEDFRRGLADCERALAARAVRFARF